MTSSRISSAFIREQKRYSLHDLEKILCCSSEKTIGIIRKLKEYGLLKTVKSTDNQKDLSDLSDEDVVVADVENSENEYLYVFTFVGVIVVAGCVLKCYPKYLPDNAQPLIELKQILKVLAERNCVRRLCCRLSCCCGLLSGLSCRLCRCCYGCCRNGCGCCRRCRCNGCCRCRCYGSGRNYRSCGSCCNRCGCCYGCWCNGCCLGNCILKFESTTTTESCAIRIFFSAIRTKHRRTPSSGIKPENIISLL